MDIIPTFAPMVFVLVVIGLAARLLDQRELEERLEAESLEAREVLSSSLDERLSEIDAYRHRLAALLQELDIEQVRAAEEAAEDVQE